MENLLQALLAGRAAYQSILHHVTPSSQAKDDIEMAVSAIVRSEGGWQASPSAKEVEESKSGRRLRRSSLEDTKVSSVMM